MRRKAKCKEFLLRFLLRIVFKNSKKIRGSSFHNSNGNNLESFAEKNTSFLKPPSNFKKSGSEKNDSMKSIELNNHCKSHSLSQHMSIINENSDNFNNFNHNCNENHTDFGTAKFEFKGKNVIFLIFL